MTGRTLRSALGCGLMLAMASATAHAGWMAGYGNVSLSSLVLPGSHDSGSYHSAGIGISPDDSELAWLPPSMVPIVENWGLAQKQSIGQQAQLGYRYFDIRLCANGDAVYTCHGVYMVPFNDIITQLQTYLASADAASEVIVLDINHLYAMTPSNHAAVIQQLRTALGAWAANPSMFPAGVDGTVSSFTSAGKHIIISYADDTTLQANPDLLWPQSIIDSPWPNLQLLWQLETWLEGNNTRAHANQIFVHQAQLTPATANVISGLLLPKVFPTSLAAFTSRYTPSEQRWMNTSKGIAAVGNGGIIIQDDVDSWQVNYAIARNQQLFPNP